MNDVLLAIWDHIIPFQPEKNSFKNWIAAIAKYKKRLDYLRKYQKEQMEVSLETAECDRIMESKLPVVADADEISEEMEALLSCLSKRDRDLFLRLYVEEESVAEISQSAKLRKSVIYNRLSRKKKKLRARKKNNKSKILMSKNGSV